MFPTFEPTGCTATRRASRNQIPPFGRPRRARLGLLVLALTACPGARAPDGGAARSPEPTPVPGGALRALLADDVDSLDPHRAARPSSWFFARALHRGLMAFPDEPAGEGSSPVSDLAAGQPLVSADRLTYTFTLREGIRFGAPASRPIRAQDARASIERLLRSDAGIAPFLRVIRGADRFVAGRARGVSGITVPDDRTLRIRLARPSDDVLWLLAHPQAAVLPEGSPPIGAAFPTALAGAGPYRLAAYEPEARIALERNEEWSAATDPVRPAYLDRIVADLGVEPPRALDRIATGKADLLVDPGPPDERPAAESRNALRVEQTESACMRYLFLNRQVAPFRDRAARRAVAHAVLRARLPGVGTTARVAPRILPPPVLGHRDRPVLRESLDEARAQLARADLSGGFRTTLVVGDSTRDRGEARALRAALARAGIRVTVRTVRPATLYPDRYERPDARTPMGIATWCADWPGPAGRGMLGPLVDPRAPASTAYAHPRSAALERALDAATAAPASDAAAAWEAADRAATATAFVIPLAWPSEDVAISSRLRGWRGAPMWPRGDPTALWAARS